MAHKKHIFIELIRLIPFSEALNSMKVVLNTCHRCGHFDYNCFEIILIITATILRFLCKFRTRNMCGFGIWRWKICWTSLFTFYNNNMPNVQCPVSILLLFVQFSISFRIICLQTFKRFLFFTVRLIFHEMMKIFRLYFPFICKRNVIFR